MMNVIMGGDHSKIHPHSYARWRKNHKIWSILENGNFMTFLERLHDHEPKALTDFVSFWHNRRLQVGDWTL